MSADIEKNKAFLRNIYRKGEFQGHGFCCLPAGTPIYELPHGDYTLSDRPVEEWIPWIARDYEKQVEMLEQTGHDDVPTARLMTGTHLYAHAFGSPIKVFEDSNPCALPFVTTAEEADGIQEPDIWSTPVLARVFELGRAVQAELGEDAYLGPCDVQSGFDTACLIWDKTHLYCALADPEGRAAVMRLVEKCARVLKESLMALREEFPNLSPCHCPSVWAPPEMPPWLSNDECGAVSTAMFEEFQLPELIELSRHFGGLGMHCCATAEHQFESFKKVPGFYAFNRCPADRGFDPILEHFGGPDAPVHVLAWIAESDIARLIRNAPEGTRFIFANMGCSVEACKQWLARMRELSPRTD
jgi:hypothetical protein